jgi:hypothetical protein
MNISKDLEEDQSKYELLLRFINPKVATEAFDRTVEEIEVDDDTFLKEINEHTTAPIKSIDDLERIATKKYDESLDRIERVD